MKALITGADGFIGSHLTELLIEKGYHVRALSYYNSFNYWGWLEEISKLPNLEIISGDIRDSNFCRQIVKDVDIIFHLASLIAIPYSYIAPESYIETNVKGTLNICQAAKEVGNLRLIHTSTSEVYGTAKYIPIDENHPKQPQSPYSASKISADMVALSFYYSYNLPVTIVRPFNTFGPRQSGRAIIPSILIQILSGINPISVGDLSTTRDLNYVKDVVEGFYLISINEDTIGLEINISSNSEISMLEIFQLICKLLNREVDYKLDLSRVRPKSSEVYRLRGDNTLIKKLTNWSPKYSLEKGLIEVIEWFKNPQNLVKYKSNIYNI